MKTLRMTGQFKKDLKRYKNQKEKLEELAKILSLLTENKEIPLRYNPHHLSGDDKDCMECHIQGDCWLIWIDEQNDTVGLLRLGTHSELFGKGAKK